MQDASVLYVAALADHDGVTVGAEHRPYHMLASAPMVTRPMSTAPGAMNGDIGAVWAESEQYRQAGDGSDTAHARRHRGCPSRPGGQILGIQSARARSGVRASASSSTIQRVA
jgi:hypothetical protein